MAGSITGGSVVWDFDVNKGKFDSALKDSSQQVKKFSDHTQDQNEKANKSWLKQGAVMGAVAGIATTVLTKAFDVVSQSISSAIRRVDTLNNFPLVMSNMGISADESSKAIKDLSDELQGLPTSIDTAALAVQRLTTTTGDVNKAKDIFLALNNAVLAGGAPMELQATAIEQFSQGFAKGRIDMMEWRSILSAMPAQLLQLSKAMGFPNSEALGEALRKGEVSMTQFSDALVKMNKTGTAGFQSFEKQAKNSTGGIGTSFVNMQTAITRGLANILGAIGRENISGAITNVGKAFESALKVVAQALIILIGIIKTVSGFISRNKELFMDIATVIGVIMIPMLIQFARQAVTSITIYLTQVALAAARTYAAAVRMAASWLLAMGPIGLVVAAVVAALIILQRRFNIFGKAWALITEAFRDTVEFFKRNTATFKKILIGIAALMLLPVLPMILMAVLVKRNFEKIKTTIISVWQTVWSVVRPILKFFLDLHIIVWGSILLVILTVLGAIKTAVVAAFKFVAGVASDVWGAVSRVTSTAFQFIYNVIKTYVTFWFNIYKTVLTAILNFTKMIWSAVSSTIMSIVRGVLNFFAPAGQWLLERGKQLIQGFVNGIRALAGVVSSAVKFVADKIGSFFSGAGSWLYNTGRAIVQGLINGIRDMVGAVSRAAGEVGDAVQSKIKNVLGIRSPSRVMTEFGMQTMQGFANGLAKGNTQVLRAMDSNLQNSFSPMINPTITGTGQTNNKTEINNNIGEIIIGNDADGEYWIKKLTRSDETTKLGLTGGLNV